MQDEKNTITEKINHPAFEWEFPEFEKYHKSRLWVLVAGLITMGCLIYSVIVGNFLFSLIIVLVLFLFIVREFSEPDAIQCRIYGDGIELDRKFYPFRDIEEFFILYEPPYIQKLYFHTKGLQLNITVPINNSIDPIELREYLLKYLDENLDIDDESMTEVFERILRL